MKKISISVFFLFIIINLFGQGQVSAIPTFECISLMWSGHSQSPTTPCKVRYRISGTQTWNNGFDLWGDARGNVGRIANEFRGSLVHLKSGTTYEIELTAGTSTANVTTTTWSETFPVGSTTTLSSPTTISTSGTPTAYRVYNGNISGGTNNLVINGSYIIIRGMTLKGAAEDAILLGSSAHDIVIEGNDISGWGFVGMGSNNQAGIRCKGGLNMVRVIIQRNKIHTSRETTNYGWDKGGRHPVGPNAVNFENCGGNHVIRYNDIGDNDGVHFLMDGLGGSDNFELTGFLNGNSDVYGNNISQVYDDAVECEGGNVNNRIWGNFMNKCFTGVATSAVIAGPCYVFNNITNVSQRLYAGFSQSDIDNEDRGPFNKNGSGGATGGRCYLFNNTVLEPRQTGFTNARGMSGGPVDNGGSGGVKNVYSRNNIWQVHNTNRQSIGENFSTSGNGDYDYDLYNGTILVKSTSKVGTHMIKASPTYASSVGLELNPDGYFLAASSKGMDVGQVLNNFTDGFTGAAPDMGAYETGTPKLEFGVTAYLGTTPPPPINQPPTAMANASSGSITLPNNSVTLSGTGTDSDGSIILYSWSEVSGKTNYSLGSPNSPTTTASNLIEGKYTFRLTVTDNKGATGFADVNVTVNPAPPDPAKVFSVYQDVIIKYSDSTTKKVRIYH